MLGLISTASYFDFLSKRGVEQLFGACGNMSLVIA
jgi:hypothetical protein